MVTWWGRAFPRGASEGGLETPEAFHSVSGLLPHLHEDLEDRLPNAVAGPDAGDKDPEQEESLERRGEKLGRSKARFTTS